MSKNMSIDEMVELLKNGGFRYFERSHQMGSINYLVKVYKIGPPHSLIRIDIKEEIKNGS